MPASFLSAAHAATLAAALAAALLATGAHAAPGVKEAAFCRARTSLPPGSYQQSCSCSVEHCDYLVCTCDGQYHSTFKITSCTSQSFSDRGGALACD